MAPTTYPEAFDLEYEAWAEAREATPDEMDAYYAEDLMEEIAERQRDLAENGFDLDAALDAYRDDGEWTAFSPSTPGYDGPDDEEPVLGCPWCEPRPYNGGPTIPALFTSAPKMKALYIDGIKLSRAPESGRNAGSIYVCSADGEDYFGRIDAAGAWLPTRAAGGWALLETLEMLEALGTAYLAGRGRATGRCCYCGRFLTDAVSVELGYGPICATYHGLPHKAVKVA